MGLPFARKQAGREGEEEAARFLEGQGLRVLARNVRYRVGEIDIVALDGATLVFVEVKARRGEAHGSPAEAVDGGKRRRFLRAATIYAAERCASESEIRFDVVAVDLARRGRERVRHYRGAFGVDG